jgi:predicted NodU family carbamoyl transferase
MKINNYVIGISDSHGSGICLIKKKKVTFAINKGKIHDYKMIKIFQKTIKLARKN